MNEELVVNTFWFFSIFTASIYMVRKRYMNKKEFSLIDKIFKLSLSLSIILIILSLYFMVTNSKLLSRAQLYKVHSPPIAHAWVV